MSQTSISLPSIREMLPEYWSTTQRPLSLNSASAFPGNSPDCDPKYASSLRLTGPFNSARISSQQADRRSSTLRQNSSHVKLSPPSDSILQSAQRRPTGSFPDGRISAHGARDLLQCPTSDSTFTPTRAHDTPRVTSVASAPSNVDGSFRTYSYTYSTAPLKKSLHRESGKHPTHSFDVLRSHPHTASLEHITSSTILGSRNSSSTQTSSSAGITNGSVPAFRVSLPPQTDASPSTPFQQLRLVDAGLAMDHDDRDAKIFDGVTSPPSTVQPDVHVDSVASSVQPVIISFPVSGSPASLAAEGTMSRMYTKELDTQSDARKGRDDGRGRKHQCPHCFKRFNRPSSLKIHVNTHTGAKPFQCPHPSCGREFNVNSNMRRHLRNHSLSRGSRQRAYSTSQDKRSRGRRNSSGDRLRSSTSLSPVDQYTGLPALSRASTAANLEADLGHGDIEMDDEIDYDESEEDEEDELQDDEEDDNSLKRNAAAPSSPETSTSSLGENAYLHSHPRVRPQLIPAVQSLPRSQSPHPGYLYSPSSAELLRSCTDSRVSTALRPAFANSYSVEPRIAIKIEDLL